MRQIFFDINGVLALIKRPERLQQVKDAYDTLKDKEPNKLRTSAMSRLRTEKKILTQAHRLDLGKPDESFLVALRPGAEYVIKAAYELGQLYTITDSSRWLIKRTCHTLGISEWFEDFYSTKDEDRLVSHLPPQMDNINPWLLISKHPFDRKLRMLGVSVDEDIQYTETTDDIIQEHVIHPRHWEGRDEDPQPMLDLAQTLKEKLM